MCDNDYKDDEMERRENAKIPHMPDSKEIAEEERAMAEKKPKNVREIVAEYLKANGYDGLWQEECGCRLDNLMPCDAPHLWDCFPGVIHLDFDVEDCDFWIGPCKEEGDERPDDSEQTKAEPAPYSPDLAITPGETIRDMMEAQDIGYECLRQALDVGFWATENLVDGEGELTPQIADALAKLFDTPASFWLNLEKQYRERWKGSDNYEMPAM